MKRGTILRSSRRSRGPQREYFASHPLVDNVILPATWREVQPAKNTWDFSGLEEQVDYWSSKGKHCIVSVGLYGQAPNDMETPPWIYDEPGVTEIRFFGGGQAHGKEIRIPAVWEVGFAGRYVRPIANKLQGVFGESVTYIPGCGHIGNLTCQPSPDGSEACLGAGWTPDRWSEYCKNAASYYRQHERLIMSAGIMLRSRSHNHYRPELVVLLDALLENHNISLAHFGLGADKQSMEMQDLAANMERLLPINGKLCLGDDWPLWVPAERRDKSPTIGHDDAYLRKSYENAFEYPIECLWVNEPLLEAPPPVTAILESARDRLLKPEPSNPCERYITFLKEIRNIAPTGSRVFTLANDALESEGGDDRPSQ